MNKVLIKFKLTDFLQYCVCFVILFIFKFIQFHVELVWKLGLMKLVTKYLKKVNKEL